MKTLAGECVNRMSRAVEEFGGLVQSIMGDGICGVFGMPAAHEDDPERAARAALRIVEVVGEYARDVEAAWGIPTASTSTAATAGSSPTSGRCAP